MSTHKRADAAKGSPVSKGAATAKGATDSSTRTPVQVSLFVTCLADLFRPSVGFASINLLQRAGCEVSVPLQQTCCGQPAYNSGDYEATIPVAKTLITQFEHADYVVAPSGSCVGMICHHYARILEDEWHDRALQLAAKTFELTQFLHDVIGIGGDSLKTPAELQAIGPVTYHDSCAGLRELHLKEQPRKLLKKLLGLEITEMDQTDVCCGFGGAFCGKMPEISGNMADNKLARAQETGAVVLTGTDLGCLMHIAGRARRLGNNLEVRHIVELLEGDLQQPAIGQGEQ